MKKTALVTGGAGFIGSNLSNRLISEGWNVTVADDLSAGRVEFVHDLVDLYTCDFASEEMLALVRSRHFDTVFHLAAKPRVSYSVEHLAETTDINVNRTVELLDACRGNVRRFINTSSSSVYGGAETLPTLERDPHDPKSPYALQKSVIERFCVMCSELYDMDTVSIRPFNVFGPNQLGDNPYATAIAAWLHAVKHGNPLRSDGTGEQTRDMTYVDNVVDVFVRCANHEGRFRGDAFNAGTGDRTANNQILEWFRREYPKCEVASAPWRAGDVMHTQASIDKATRVLGYVPRVSLWDGLKKTRAWAMSNPLF